LTKANTGLNRKILADMAVKSPEDFAKLVDSINDAS